MFTAPPPSAGHTIVQSVDQLAAMVREVSTAKTVGVDFETSGLRYFDGQLPIGFSVGYLTGRGYRAWYVPVAHKAVGAQIPRDAAQEAFRDALAQAAELVGHNLKFDLNMGRADGWEIPDWTPIHDSMIQAYLIDEGRALQLEKVVDRAGVSPYQDAFAMKDEVDRFLVLQAGLSQMGKQEYLNRHGHEHVPIQLEGEYGCRDVVHSLLLDRKQRSAAMGVGGRYERQKRALYENEMILVRALADMEYQGQLLDVEYLRRVSLYLDQELDRLGGELRRLFGVGLNWANDVVVRNYLYTSLKMPVLEWTPKGLPSVSRSALMFMVSSHPGIETLIEYRAHCKVRTTYTDSLIGLVDKDGRLHPSFLQWGAGTGRLSGRAPNLMNIPARHKKLARLVRQAFVVEPGKVRVFSDYSQIELRMLAWITGSAVLLGAYESASYMAWVRGETDYEGFRRGRASEPSTDVHSDMTRSIFGVDERDPDWKGKRRAIKVVNFGVPYGAGWGLLVSSPELRLPEHQAKSIFQDYHARNPEVESTRKRLLAKMRADRDLSFTNWAGRTRHGRRLLWSTETVKGRLTVGEEERSMFASVVQGSAAELTRLSIVRTYLLQKRGLMPGNSTSTVHDEIQFDCDRSDVRDAALIAQREMESYPGLFGTVPVVADLEVTDTNWADKKEWKDS